MHGEIYLRFVGIECFREGEICVSAKKRGYIFMSRCTKYKWLGLGIRLGFVIACHER